MANGKLLHISSYNGTYLAPKVVAQAQEMIKAFTNPPAGYSMDLGIEESGRISLVEINDGFSLGAYDGLTGEDYYTLLSARWNQMINGN